LPGCPSTLGVAVGARRGSGVPGAAERDSAIPACQTELNQPALYERRTRAAQPVPSLTVFVLTATSGYIASQVGTLDTLSHQRSAHPRAFGHRPRSRTL